MHIVSALGNKPASNGAAPVVATPNARRRECMSCLIERMARS